MDDNLHIHFHLGDDAVERRLRRIEHGINKLLEASMAQSKELDALEQAVTRDTEVDQSAITLINGLAAQIQQLKNDPAKLQALADSMKGNADALAAAVAANTPADAGAGTGDAGGTDTGGGTTDTGGQV